MPGMEITTVSERDLSHAWLSTLNAVRRAPGGVQFHMVTRIASPTEEDDTIRAAADALMLSRSGQDPIETVANTVFPASMARTSHDPGALVERYRRALPTIKRLDTNNARGTYFGRIVEYAGPDGSIDQLTHLIDKLRHEQTNTSPKTARYEVAVEQPHDDTDTDTEDRINGDLDQASTVASSIYTPGRDNAIMSFPCLSSLSFQLDRRRLHLLAHYRSQLMVRRGYGNYLGLSRLLGYVAANAGLQPGIMTVVAGRARADLKVRRLAALNDEICSIPLPLS